MMSPSLISQFIDGRTIKIDGKEFLFCSGTAYLGIPYTEAFKDFFIEGLHVYGTGYAGSPAGNMKLQVYEYAEELLARWLQAEDAICLSSGMLAGQCVVNFFHEKADFIYLKNSHAALWKHTQPDRFYHENLELAEIQKAIDNSSRDIVLILASSTDVLTPKILSFDFLHQINNKNKNIIFILDDSHAFGVIGENIGSGHLAMLKKRFPSFDALALGSLGKGAGIPAGVIAGSHTWIDQIRNTAFYRSASPPAPAAMYAFSKIWPSLYQTQIARLQKSLEMVETWDLIRDVFDYTHSYPVFVSKKEGLYNHLFQQGIWLSSFPYPSSDDLPVTRLVINALLTHEDMDRIHHALVSFDG
jgi:8-amino-7-oxononanoate synthase